MRVGAPLIQAQAGEGGSNGLCKHRDNSDCSTRPMWGRRRLISVRWLAWLYALTLFGLTFVALGSGALQQHPEPKIKMLHKLESKISPIKASNRTGSPLDRLNLGPYPLHRADPNPLGS